VGKDVAPVDSPEILARFHGELDLVDIAAKQLLHQVSRAVTLDDLRGFGREGLLNAARTFDATRGLAFRRWANLRIKGAMIDGVRQFGSLPRRVFERLRGLEAGDRVLEAYEEEDAAGPAGTAEAADDRLATYLAGIATAIAVGTMVGAPRTNVDAHGRDVTPEDLFGDAEVLAMVKDIVGRLPEQERLIVERHYFEGQQLDEAARSIGLSKSWGSRLHARAIESITKELRRVRAV
jgi:RNA polymerase sigma factor for flagellar operon FliA